MDLNEFIYRDDTAQTLGAEIGADESTAIESRAGYIESAKIGLAAVGGAVLGMSHFLGLAGKHL
jgi:hypothetical protein